VWQVDAADEAQCNTNTRMLRPGSSSCRCCVVMCNTDGGGCCCVGRLGSLAKLSVQSNRLTSMRGLEACTALQELYLSHNGIETLEVSCEINIACTVQKACISSDLQQSVQDETYCYMPHSEFWGGCV